MARSGLKWLKLAEMDGHLLKWLERLEWLETTGNGWKWLEMAENFSKWLEWQEMDVMAVIAGNGWKWLEVAENGWKGMGVGDQSHHSQRAWLTQEDLWKNCIGGGQNDTCVM